MILFFDTETTGFTAPTRPIDDPSQPYIVQLAAQLCHEDGRPACGFSLIIDNGVEIPEKAKAVHGITEEHCARVGVSAQFALAMFAHLHHRAELIVAHHMKFDKAVIETAMTRVAGCEMRLTKPLFCTMEAARPVINLPAAGISRPKAPKLAECIKHFFDEELGGAHDAQADMLACARVYFHLRSLLEPERTHDEQDHEAESPDEGGTLAPGGQEIGAGQGSQAGG